MAIHTFYKLLHIVAVIMFLGNIVTGLFWMRIAVKTKDLKIISHSINGVIKSDRIFTVPGVLLIIAGGFLGAIYAGYPIIRTGWIFYSLILFSISGISFGIKVAPLQKTIYKMTVNQENNAGYNWDLFNKKFKEWEAWGLIALITPFIALVMMVLKIPR
jgi:uncharacterized membrane protein